MEKPPFVKKVLEFLEPFNYSNVLYSEASETNPLSWVRVDIPKYSQHSKVNKLLVFIENEKVYKLRFFRQITSGKFSRRRINAKEFNVVDKQEFENVFKKVTLIKN